LSVFTQLRGILPAFAQFGVSMTKDEELCGADAGEEPVTPQEALDALIDSERRFRILVQGVVDYAIYMLDPHGIVTNWNVGAERIKGYQANEIIGQHFSKFYTEEDRLAGVPVRGLATAAREGKFESEGWRVRKNGERFWASVVVDAIRDENGELLGFAKVTRDMTERRKAQEELNEAREQLFQMQKLEAVGQLTGGIAHDFNNLLTIVIGNVEMAQRNLEKNQASSSQQILRLLGNALAGAKRAATLTQRLLAFARRQPLDPKPLDVNKFIAGMGEFLRRTLGEQISVEAVGFGGLWPVEVDTVQLESAILNLALNARDAMPDGGKLTVEATNVYLDERYGRKNPDITPGQYVMISVTDTGTGMSAQTLARAFEPFFTTKIVGQGTGLGLSQVYGFVKQSGGNVKVYSELGEGTTIKIYLPRISSEVADAHFEAEEVVPAAGETILVVEDEPAVLDYVVELLSHLNYQVLPAGDGATALKYLRDTNVTIDLMLSDVVMPDMHGCEVAEQARQIRPDLKVLFMTGYPQNAIVHQGRLEPGFQLIQKPLSEGQLASRIRDLLDLPGRFA
jgi:PAS domain S-box-containing protein